MTSTDRTLDVTAELLAEGYEPDEITLLALADRVVRCLVKRAVDFELSGANLDRPNAEKYGTHPDGSPRHAPEWYAVMGAKTGILEGLHGALRSVLTCPSADVHGHRCIGIDQELVRGQQLRDELTEALRITTADCVDAQTERDRLRDALDWLHDEMYPDDPLARGVLLAVLEQRPWENTSD